MGKMGRFWSGVISSKDATSSKRLVTLIISLHFIISCFCILFFAFNVVYRLPKGKIEPELIGLLKDVLEYDFYIILSGLGFITADNMGQMMLERTRAKVAGNVQVGAPNADTIQVDTMNIKQTVTNDNTTTATTDSTNPNSPESSGTNQPLQ